MYTHIYIYIYICIYIVATHTHAPTDGSECSGSRMALSTSGCRFLAPLHICICTYICKCILSAWPLMLPPFECVAFNAPARILSAWPLMLPPALQRRIVCAS